MSSPAPSDTLDCVGTSWGNLERKLFLKERSALHHILWDNETKSKAKRDIQHEVIKVSNSYI